MFEALTDLYALLPLGSDGRGHAVPLLRKPHAARPGLTGAALEKAVDAFIARVHHAPGSRMN